MAARWPARGAGQVGGLGVGCNRNLGEKGGRHRKGCERSRVGSDFVACRKKTMTTTTTTNATTTLTRALLLQLHCAVVYGQCIGIAPRPIFPLLSPVGLARGRP